MSDPEITPSEPDPTPEADVRADGSRPNADDLSEEIVNPEDLPAQIEVAEHDGVTRIDIADDAVTRPGDVEPA